MKQKHKPQKCWNHKQHREVWINHSSACSRVLSICQVIERVDITGTRSLPRLHPTEAIKGIYSVREFCNLLNTLHAFPCTILLKHNPYSMLNLITECGLVQKGPSLSWRSFQCPQIWSKRTQNDCVQCLNESAVLFLTDQRRWRLSTWNRLTKRKAMTSERKEMVSDFSEMIKPGIIEFRWQILIYKT